jgi:hypothetical protein
MPVERRAPHFELGVSPRRVALALLLIAGALWLASLTAGLVIDPIDGFPGRGGLLRLLNLDNELNPGTWYSSGLLALCAAVLAVIALAKRSSRDRHALGWAALSLIFLYLSLDETASLHEETYGIGQDLPGPVYVVALVPAIVVTSLAALAFLRFLAALPAHIRNLFLLAAAMLVGGAVGVEIVDGGIADHFGNGSALYKLVSSSEETMEMAGSITFLYALMLYVAAEFREVTVRFSPSSGGEPPTAAPGEVDGWPAGPTGGPDGDG